MPDLEYVALSPVALRKERKMSVNAAAKALELSQQSLGRYERRERMPDPAILDRMRRLYGVSEGSGWALVKFWLGVKS